MLLPISDLLVRHTVSPISRIQAHTPGLSTQIVTKTNLNSPVQVGLFSLNKTH